ncbi:MAG TPA: protein translocase subunit SecF [Gemmatimonadaceae bacterium]|nr:protein translocase subunit SecF [Gemmatimonadaceae bacterium]
MLRILHGTNYDFIKWWKWAAGLTIAFLLVGLVSYMMAPINYSIEFTGGTLMQTEFKQPLDVANLRSRLNAAGITGAEIQQFGSAREFTIRAQESRLVAAQQAQAGTIARRIGQVLTSTYGADNVRIVRSEAIGPRVSEELQSKALIAMILSFIITLIYLAIRFEWRFGAAAVIATAHDFVATLVFLKLMNLEVSLMVVAGLLTVIGYSMNDTVIIFDRVRENLHKSRNESMYDTLNRSINETLPRSIITHALSLSSVIALLVLGGEVIRPFAWVMAFGIFTGTFSSMYVAAPILIWIERKWPRKTSVSRRSPTVTRTSPIQRSRVTATR